ncbi:hypothetical protein BKA81DRAFT_47492 [Phyllosticta paracitricarpa]
MSSPFTYGEPSPRYVPAAVGEEEDDPTGGIQKRVMLKVLYTFDDSHKTCCLARLPNALNIPTVMVDDETQVGVIELRTCVEAIVSASPELVAKLGHDFTVYAYDYSEYETPLVGQGMLSWILASASPALDAPSNTQKTMVTGKVRENILGLFSGGIKETLEVKLKLVPVPTILQSDYLETMEKYRSLGQFIPEGFDHSAWMNFLKTNPDITTITAHLQGTPFPQSAALQRINPGGVESLHQLLTQSSSPHEERRGSQQYAAQPMSQSRQGSRACSPAASMRSGVAFQQPQRDHSRPASSASHTSERPFSQQPSFAQPASETSCGQNRNQELEHEECPPRKRARVVQADWRGKSQFGPRADTLRITASNAASVRVHKPAPINLASEGPSNTLEPPQRPPTPRPTELPGARARATMNVSSLRRESSLGSTQYGQRGPYSESGVASEDDQMADAEDSPAEFPSSPPICPPNHNSPAPSSPGLPTFPCTDDSGFMSGSVFEPEMATENRRYLGAHHPTSEAPTVVASDQWKIETPGPPEMLPTRVGRRQQHYKQRQVEEAAAAAAVRAVSSDGDVVVRKPETRGRKRNNTKKPPPPPTQHKLAPMTAAPPTHYQPGPVSSPHLGPIHQPRPMSVPPAPASWQNLPPAQQQSRVDSPRPIPMQLPPGQEQQSQPQQQAEPSQMLLHTSEQGQPEPTPNQTSPVPTSSPPVNPVSASTAAPNAQPEQVSVGGSSQKAVKVSKPKNVPPAHTGSASASTGNGDGKVSGNAQPPQSTSRSASPAGSVLRSGSGAKRKKAIEDKLQGCLLEGKMPDFCAVCGEIKTPTWRKAFYKVVEGIPGSIATSLDEPGAIAGYEIVVPGPDEENARPKYKLYKRSLSNEDKANNDYTPMQLCNPCGLHFAKAGTMRPPARWEPKVKERKRGRPRKRNPPKKDACASDAMEEPMSSLCTDPAYPSDMMEWAQQETSGKAGTPQNGESHEDPTSQKTVKEKTEPSPEQDLAGNDQGTRPAKRQRAASWQPLDGKVELQLTQANQARRSAGREVFSSPPRVVGSQESPINVEEDSPSERPTRRLLFPSPRKDGQFKSLADGAKGKDKGDLLRTVGQKPPPLDFGNSANGKDKENMPPPSDEDSSFAHLFEEGSNNASKSATPVNRSVQDILKTPGSKGNRVALTPKGSARKVVADLLNLTPSKTIKTPKANGTPLSASLQELFKSPGSASRARDWLSSPGTARLFDFSDFDVDLFPTSDFPVPSSPSQGSNGFNFSLYEDPMTSSNALDNFWFSAGGNGLQLTDGGQGADGDQNAHLEEFTTLVDEVMKSANGTTSDKGEKDDEAAQDGEVAATPENEEVALV